MRIAPILLASSGIALALGCAVVAQRVLGTETPVAQVAETPETVVLIAAARDIRFGEAIRRDDLVPQTWPADLVPDEAYDSATALLGVEGTAPRRATQTIREGEVILARNVSEFGATVTIGSTLAPGTRAVAIRVNADTAVGGFVSPGDRVDIVLTEGRGDTLRTGVILQDTRVLAVDQDTEARGARMARTITVEVAPRDSQRLVLAQEAGQLSLILRHEGPEERTDAPDQITMRDVWGDPEPEPEPEVVVQAPTIDPTTVRVRRGVASEEIVLSQ
ncbi:Flp pilus assembly protein CpaB [Maritimibacter sp. UBA3975]|uniref:Flp pilus assembly protein CpaB n=1 Tax=Maritimibacter sp. UBA3975 TaxID=1946833 RepID=UPI0025C1CAC0|nr:Flp pilus assembly protein CpaB [Maritimibacter sp. UBA3975]|tara:strand:- start:2129 stop:2956 length:828 start_codon:yes stop_codon:yes gene_type:complete